MGTGGWLGFGHDPLDLATFHCHESLCQRISQRLPWQNGSGRFPLQGNISGRLRVGDSEVRLGCDGRRTRRRRSTYF
jgi:hypothetical protein